MNILFTRRRAHVRVLRLAAGLRRTGRHKLFLLYGTNVGRLMHMYRWLMGLLRGQWYRPAGLLKSDVYRGLFDGIDTYASAGELARKLQRYCDVDIVHALAEPNVDVEVAIRSANSRVVFDPVDITSMRFGDNKQVNQAELEAERFCFEHTHGIVHKGPEIQYARERYAIQCPTLHFSNYCMDDWIVKDPLPKRSQRDTEWHFVIAGGISPLFISPRGYEYNQYGELAKRLAQQRIHLHLYPPPTQGNPLATYALLAARNPYLHLHNGLPASEIGQEISQYDFGIWIHPKNPLVTDDSYRLAIGNKFFTYLESGLPIIINHDLVYGSELVREHRVGIVFNYDREVDQLKNIIAACDYQALCTNVRAAREQLALSQQIARLEEFYRLVLHQVGPRSPTGSSIS